jgi:hypothetical protein
MLMFTTGRLGFGAAHDGGGHDLPRMSFKGGPHNY